MCGWACGDTHLTCFKGPHPPGGVEPLSAVDLGDSPSGGPAI